MAQLQHMAESSCRLREASWRMVNIDIEMGDSENATPSTQVLTTETNVKNLLLWRECRVSRNSLGFASKKSYAGHHQKPVHSEVSISPQSPPYFFAHTQLSRLSLQQYQHRQVSDIIFPLVLHLVCSFSMMSV